jgi:hypothetical protein
VILDAPDAFVQAPELERSEVYVPQAVTDFFETDVKVDDDRESRYTALADWFERHAEHPAVWFR